MAAPRAEPALPERSLVAAMTGADSVVQMVATDDPSDDVADDDLEPLDVDGTPDAAPDKRS